MKKDNEISVNAYRIGRLTILEIMAVLAVLGLLATWVLHHFFA